MIARFPEAAVFAPEDLRVGMTARFERDIAEQDVHAFADLSGDANPLHVDAAYAATTNYGERIVHGAFQVGLGSALVGMLLPGRNVLLGAVSARFPSPLRYPSRVIVSGEISSWSEARRAGVMRIAVHEARTGTPTAEILMHFAFHEQRDAPQRAERTGQGADGAAARTGAANRSPSFDADDRPIVVVTGARGGLGAEILASLSTAYATVAFVRQRGAIPPEAGGRGAREVVCDLQDERWRDVLADALGGRPVYGIVHAAWPGQPHGSLLQLETDVVEQQLTFGALSTIALARFLFSQPETAGGGRLVVLGSIAGTLKPVLPLAAYSLGKAALEHAVRLLAPELARRRITINAISPSFVAAGLNRQATARQQMKEASLVPLGRVCGTDDVTALVQFLLSPGAAFVSGQTIGLTGAQL
jgi:3-oxoacyl-[acyl-carrier protein] reductase